MAIAMVIIAQYHMEVNLFGETICKSEEEPVCPICQTKLNSAIGDGEYPLRKVAR